MTDRTARAPIGRRVAVIGFTVASVIAAMISAPVTSTAATQKWTSGNSSSARPAPRPPSQHPLLKAQAVKVRAPLSATPTLATPAAVTHTYTVDDLVNDTGDNAWGDGVCDAGSGNCTLRAAIEEANADSGATQINVPAGTITLTSELNPSSDMFIAGAGSGSTTVDAAGTGRVFNIDGGAIEISGMTITGGTGDYGPGAGIYLNWAAVTLSNVVLEGNDAGSYEGGGVYVDSAGSLWVVDSQIRANHSDQAGGGLSVYYGGVYLRDSTFGGSTSSDANSAGVPDAIEGSGGALYNDYGNVVAENVTFSHNTATYNGGAINTYGTATFTGGSITANTVEGGPGDYAYAGGIYNSYVLTMTGTTIANNVARGHNVAGGGLYTSDTAQLTDVDVTGNAAFTTDVGYEIYGGGVYGYGSLQISGGSVTNNTATLDASADPTGFWAAFYGGGLYLEGSYSTSIDGLSVTGNSIAAGDYGSAHGGGAYVNAASVIKSADVSGNTISGQYAYGGGLFVISGTANLDTVTIDGNSATASTFADGAGMDAEYYTQLRNVTFDANAATVTGASGGIEGGALFLYDRATLDRVQITGTTVDATVTDGMIWGGGMFAHDALAMTNSNVLDTTASAGRWLYGAGAYLAGTSTPTDTIASTAIAGNTGNVSAASGYALGGGVGMEEGALTSVNLTNVTLASNSLTAGGGGQAYIGGIFIGNDTRMTNATLAGNHADTSAGGLGVGYYTVTLKNTIVSGNTSTGTTNCEIAGGGAIVSTGYNLEDQNTCGLANKGDQVDTDPLLGPLQDNGGNTMTMLPADNSPAVNAATMNGAPKTDQRGVPRPQGPGPDVGAVEVFGGTAPVITSADHATFGVGVPGLSTVTTTGDPTPALSKTGALPTGVQFVDNHDGTASIAGTPGTGTAGTYPISITAANGVSPNDTQSFTLTVVAPLTIITTSPLTAGTVGTAYSATLVATGGATPYVWSLLSGKLPKGLKLSSSGGTISGTPHASGTFSFTILVHDSSSPPMTATATFSLTIAPRH